MNCNPTPYSRIIKVCVLVHIFLFQTFLCAQQELNFNFEKTSIEHPIRPWGWAVESQENTQMQLDSLTVFEGKYSFRIENNIQEELKGTTMMKFDMETLALQGKKITITSNLKTQKLNGDAYVSIYDDTENKILVRTPKAKKDQDWKKFSIDYNVPKTAKEVSVTLNFVGYGQIWFDELCLFIDGTKHTKLEVAPPFKANQEQWIEEHAYPLRSTRLSKPWEDHDFEDLRAFKEMVGETKIIALGEATHGTSEFFTLKHRILAFSVKELGVRAFGLEGNMLTVEKINKYVLGGEGPAQKSMWGIFAVWYNEEVLAMVEWVRNYNDEHPDDPVQFVGYDMQELDPPLDSLYAFLEKRSSKLLKSVSNKLKDLKQNGNNYFMAADSTKLNWYNSATAAFSEIKKQETIWLEASKSERERREIIWGIQYANLIKQFAENVYKGHLSFYRDEAMSENISWFLDNAKPNTRMVIWAHDYHISRAEHPNEEYNVYWGLSMGNHLSKQYGKDYKAFGISTYQGNFLGMISYSNFAQKVCPIHKGPIGTLDEVLHRLSEKNKSTGMYLDLSEGRSQSWLVVPLRTRFANHVNIEYGYWTAYSIPYQYDGIFFVDSTSAAHPLGKN